MADTSNVGQKIWSMATVLMGFGVGKSDYLEQITYLLFLKMADDCVCQEGSAAKGRQKVQRYANTGNGSEFSLKGDKP
jgi:hypothetical protein